jgi:hypothetical protein
MLRNKKLTEKLLHLKACFEPGCFLFVLSHQADESAARLFQQVLKQVHRADECDNFDPNAEARGNP